jgi:hypothetical protein
VHRENEETPRFRESFQLLVQLGDGRPPRQKDEYGSLRLCVMDVTDELLDEAILDTVACERGVLIIFQFLDSRVSVPRVWG